MAPRPAIDWCDNRAARFVAGRSSHLRQHEAHHLRRGRRFQRRAHRAPSICRAALVCRSRSVIAGAMVPGQRSWKRESQQGLDQRQPGLRARRRCCDDDCVPCVLRRRPVRRAAPDGACRNLGFGFSLLLGHTRSRRRDRNLRGRSSCAGRTCLRVCLGCGSECRRGSGVRRLVPRVQRGGGSQAAPS